MKRKRHLSTTLAELAGRPAIEVAVDTEFKGSHTLTIQAAGRVRPDRIAVQVYRAAAIPALPREFDLGAFLPPTPEAPGGPARGVTLRPLAAIRPDLSPVAILRDLYALLEVTPCSLREGRQRLEAGPADGPTNGSWSRRAGRWEVPTLHLVLVGHFLRADLGRIFGRDFYDDLLRPATGEPLALRADARPGFVGAGPGAAFAAPLVEYAAGPGGALYAVRLEFRDTTLPFGGATLDDLARSFLGVGKDEAIGPADKADMLATFRTRTAAAYGYAIRDAVLTLRVHERMKEEDRAIYRAFAWDEAAIPRMRPTLGGRAAQFLVEAALREAAGSVGLGTRRRLTRLMRRGGLATFRGDRAASRFGEQAGRAHGGPNFSRTPTRFWHEAPGMIRDADMSGCYNRILSGMAVYWGRPVVFEPGRNVVTLREAAEYAARHAAPDGWYLRVTGDVDAGLNALIPSSTEAVTSANYRRREPGHVPGGSGLFSRRIESGVVTPATWTMILALPEPLRGEYERLRVDSLVLYPSKLVAADGPEYDRLVGLHHSDDLPWEAVLDLEALQQRIVEHFDAEFVSLRFAIGDYARRVGEFRHEARLKHGKGSGPDRAWKQLGNTMYGVLAGEHQATGNVVAANQVLAAARARAFALMTALNGLQVITDGCTYRLDQVPACTFAECLRLQPDYPVRRAEAGSPIPFLDPAAVPRDDAAFAPWFTAYARAFFEAADPEYEAFFAATAAEHKPDCDAIACDGGGNYAKFRRGADGTWETGDVAMRGYGKASKAELRDWILRTYPADTLTGLAPVTQDEVLLKVPEAKVAALRALRRGADAVALPLGYPHRGVRAYKALKLSGFVFRDPAQRKAMARQVDRFVAATGCGLELLALRRGYGDRREGSLEDLAEAVYAYIQSGGRDLGKLLHLRRLSPALEETAAGRKAEAQGLRVRAAADLLDAGDVGDDLAAAIIYPRADRRLLV